jgi:hypothetical protein
VRGATRFLRFAEQNLKCTHAIDGWIAVAAGIEQVDGGSAEIVVIMLRRDDR